jgi:hypothetical protein
MPTLAAVNLAFNSVYNCMAFWFQDTRDPGIEQMGALQHHRKESAESMLAERDNTHHHHHHHYLSNENTIQFLEMCGAGAGLFDGCALGPSAAQRLVARPPFRQMDG